MCQQKFSDRLCFQKTKKASPRGDVVDDDAGLSNNENHISRVGNAYIHSDEVVVSVGHFLNYVDTHLKI